MGLTYDDFIRTTSDRHKHGVQALWRRIRDNGYIYKGHYTGQYCVFDELYVDSIGPGAPCPECGRPTETVREENYFFKLSAFQDKLIELYTGSRISSGRKRAGMKCCHSCAPVCAISR